MEKVASYQGAAVAASVIYFGTCRSAKLLNHRRKPEMAITAVPEKRPVLHFFRVTEFSELRFVLAQVQVVTHEVGQAGCVCPFRKHARRNRRSRRFRASEFLTDALMTLAAGFPQV